MLFRGLHNLMDMALRRDVRLCCLIIFSGTLIVRLLLRVVTLFGTIVRLVGAFVYGWISAGSETIDQEVEADKIARGVQANGKKTK
jgi:hypothetical protein